MIRRFCADGQHRAEPEVGQFLKRVETGRENRGLGAEESVVGGAG